MKIIVLILIWSLIAINAFSQYYVKVKGDSVRFEVDSVTLIVGSKPGNVDWQVSRDSISWHSLGETDDSLSIRIDSSAFYKAVFLDGTCYSVNSTVALVAFRSIYVTGNSVVIDSIGGVYILSSGIKLIVPPSAVNETVTLSLDLLDMNQANLKIPLDVFTGRVFCAGLFCEPTIIHFQKSIRIVVPALNYRNVDLPYIYYYDSVSGLWDQYFRTLICSENRHFIEFSTEDLYPSRIELMQDVFTPVNNTERKGVTEHEVCEKGLIAIVSSAHDNIGSFANGDCIATRINNQTKLLECSNRPISTDFVQEISAKCLPVVSVKYDRDCFPLLGSLVKMTFKMGVGGLPLVNNKIFVLLPTGIIREPVNGDPTICELFTDDSGEATLTVKSEVIDVAGTIKWNATAHYYLRVQKVSGAAGTENHEEFEKTYTFEGTLEIKVCPKALLNIVLSEHPLEYDYHMKQNETYHFGYNCMEVEHPISINCPGTVEFFVDHTFPENKKVISIDQNTGEIKTLSGGLAYVKARIRNSDIVSGEYICNVSFEGTLDVTKLNDNNHRCMCPYTGPPWEWYIMSYWGQLSFNLWLNWDQKLENNVVEVKDIQHYRYDITSAVCNNTYTSAPETLYGKIVRNSATTAQILQHFQFELTFMDLVEYQFVLNGQMTYSQPEEIDLTITDFEPEGCVGNVWGSVVLR